MSLDNSSKIFSFNSEIAAVANYLSLSTPALAYMIVSGSEQAVTGVFAHSTDPAKSAAASAGANEAVGTMSIGSVSSAVRNSNTTSANQLNTAGSIAQGSTMSNQVLDSGSKEVASNDGTRTLTQNKSNLINSANVQSGVASAASEQYAQSQQKTIQSGQQLFSSIARAKAVATEQGDSETLGQLAQLETSVTAAAGAGGGIELGIVNVKAGLEGKASSKPSATSQQQTQVSQKTSDALQDVQNKANNYNKSVSDTDAYSKAQSLVNSNGYTVSEDLSNKIYSDALKATGGDATKAEALVNDKSFIKQEATIYGAAEVESIKNKIQHDGNSLKVDVKNTNNSDAVKIKPGEIPLTRENFNEEQRLTKEEMDRHTSTSPVDYGKGALANGANATIKGAKDLIAGK